MTHWGVLLYGAPYAVPIDKGYYKELGLYVDGVLTSQGGGTTMRNVMASSLPYGEVALSAGIKRGHMVDDALQSRFELAEWARQAVDDSINSARCFGRRSQSVIVRIGAC